MQTIEHLAYWHDSASHSQQYHGSIWYGKAREQAQSIASYYGISTHRIAGVIAALSPRMPWDDNVDAARSVLQAVYDGTPLESLRIKATMRARRAAFDVLLHGPDRLSGPKVVAFYNNIIDPCDDHYVTVDTWMILASRIPHNGKRISSAQYDHVADSVRHMATCYNKLPCQIQAIIWLTIRDAHTSAYHQYSLGL